MSTKDYSLSPKKDHRHGDTSSSSSSSHGSQYSNINLNKSHECSKDNYVSSKSISPQRQSSALTKVSGYTGTENDYHNKSRNSSNSWSTSSDKGLYPKIPGYDETKENDQINNKHEKMDSSNPNASTLSLHIAAYENSREAENEDAKDDSVESVETAETEAKTIKKGKFGRALKSVKGFFTGSTSKDSNGPFSRFDQPSTPETMNFRSSQKLRNLNEPIIIDQKASDTNDKSDMSISKSSLASDTTHPPSYISTELHIPLESFTTRQALGQYAALGELYDGHTDGFCGNSLFKDNFMDFAYASEDDKIVAEFSFSDTINAKFKKFGIDGGLKLSVLSGMVKEGRDRKPLPLPISSETETTATVIFQIFTKLESLDLNNQSVLTCISSGAIETFPSATHVITSIQLGAIVYVNMTYKHQHDESKEFIAGQLERAFNQLRTCLSGVEADSEDDSLDPEKFSLHFYTEALSHYDNLPKSLGEAAMFMKELQKLIKKQGTLIPISYTMIPITSFFAQSIENIDVADRIVHDVDELVIQGVVEVYDEIVQSQKTLTALVHHSNCLENEVAQKLSGKLREFKAAKSEFQKVLYKLLMEVRYGRQASDSIIDLLLDYRNSSFTAQAITGYCNQFGTAQEKVAFIQLLTKNNVIYVGPENSMEAERKKLGLDECYEFYCDWSNEHLLAENYSIFLGLASDGSKLAFIDLQVNPFARNFNVIPQGNRICQYLNGRYIDLDCLQTWTLDQSKSWVKCLDSKDFTAEKPKKRIDVTLPCPQSFKDGCCGNSAHEWYCAACEQRLQYDFNHHFYCRCGIASVKAYQFRCSDKNHGETFACFDEDHLMPLIDEIRPNKEINILLLGETGVGKSTWINSFANYLTHATLAEAEKAKPISLIASQFTSTALVDGKYQGKTIQIGESKNENFQKGESSTQGPQSHVFTVGNKTIRIIDTPGIGDTRGVITDKENFASILQFISQFDEIHGICVLLKPNNSRLTLVFKYCINELLAHLHKSAAANIAFCFTNARNSFYRPGDTWPILERYVNELFDAQKVKIDLSQETIYCLDNEAFRFLCLLNNGIEFGNDERSNFDNSWEMSVKETQRLLSHFENDVQPHVVSETVSLNEARKIILTAAKPLADITKNIQQNIKAINRQRSEIQQANAYELKLRGKLMIKHIGIKTEPLGYPRTVCHAASCTETKRLPNCEVDKVIYKKICHEHCYLGNVTPETAPNPALQQCQAMNSSTLTCNVCGCRWDTHLHITFNQEEIEEEVEDENVQRSIDQNKSAKEIQEDAIKSLEQRIDEYKKSQADIDRILAKFASFLKKNAILAYNDTIEDYLKLNIREEKEQRTPNSELLKKMEEQLEQYQEEKRILDSRLASGEAQHVRPEEIKALQKELENLPLVGKNFKMLFDAHVRGKQTNFQYGEQYYDPYHYTNVRKRHQSTYKNYSSHNKSTMDYLKAAKKNLGDAFNYMFDF